MDEKPSTAALNDFIGADMSQFPKVCRALGWLLCATLGACGGAQYGSFVRGQEHAQAAIATDAAAKLAAEYRPDGHVIRLAQDAQDVFGRGLGDALRQKGYSVRDADAGPSRHELPVQYVLDRIKGTELLRVALDLPHRRLSRAYAQRDDGVYPAGPWSSGVHRD